MTRIEYDIKLDYKDVLIRPKRSTLKSRKEVNLNRTYTCKHSEKTWTGVPVVVANMDTSGTFEMAAAVGKHNLLTCIHKHYGLGEWKKFADTHPNIVPYVAASSGTSESDLKQLNEILATVPAVAMICLDVANGYSENFVQVVRKVRETHPSKIIMAGNVVTGEMVEELILSGADIVKVGIGPGSVCTTRKQTGVGYPQLSAVLECADAAHGLGGLIVADGGCSNPGDFAKAFGAGADFVMAGGMFAGFEESGGDLIEKKVIVGGKEELRLFKEFYGMSSTTAMKKHVGKVADYRSSEGKTVEIEFKGKAEDMVLDLLGGLRSACTYIGASSIKEMSKRTTFIRVTQQLNPVFNSKNDTSKISYK
eukprot:maker-scaffold_5-snap-gene-17.4-mRNA-1 protein AED:0.00 eAED:0.00 QI:104/1/1/1/1/1/2/61/364